MRHGKRQALQAHINELEELVDGLLVDARSGSTSAKEQMVHIHREVMDKRQRLKDLYQQDG